MELLERVICDDACAIRFDIQTLVGEQDVMAIFCTTNIDFDPLDAVVDAQSDRPLGILGRQMGQAAVGHDCDAARWHKGLEEINRRLCHGQGTDEASQSCCKRFHRLGIEGKADTGGKQPAVCARP